MVQRGRLHMAIWRMLIACWIAKAKKPHSEYVKFPTFPPAILFARKHLNVTSHVHLIACIVKNCHYIRQAANN